LGKKKEKILLLISDFITINLAFVMYFFIRVESGWFQLFMEPMFLIPMAVIFFYWLIIFLFAGMYRTWFAHSRIDEISTLLKASFIGIFILFFVIFVDDYVHGVSSTSRFVIFIYWGLFLLYVAIGRLMVRSIQRNLLIKGIGRRHTIIIGCGQKAINIFRQIKTHRALGLDVIGFLKTDSKTEVHLIDNIEVLGMVDHLEEIVDEYEIKEVVIAIEDNSQQIMLDIIAGAMNRNVGLKIVPDLYEILSGQARTIQLYGFPLIDINPQLLSEWERTAKRIIDVVVSFFILIFTSPVLLAVAAAIKIDSKGPVFFSQERCGLDGEEFKMIKFRSMYQDAEKKTGPVWSQKDDPRITKVGRFIRKVRLDEIPQMINVLKGEMSLVGPRPERPYFVEKLSKEIPYYKRRLKVRPGITGWAQVKHKYDETIEDVKTKLKYDLFYIENISLRTDMKILFRTVFVVLFGKGHYE
jgi:exopolysaccharide biosynthesis polyprenyl glycosylphosphotransferase